MQGAGCRAGVGRGGPGPGGTVCSGSLGTRRADEGSQRAAQGAVPLKLVMPRANSSHCLLPESVPKRTKPKLRGFSLPDFLHNLLCLSHSDLELFEFNLAHLHLMYITGLGEAATIHLPQHSARCLLLGSRIFLYTA